MTYTETSYLRRMSNHRSNYSTRAYRPEYTDNSEDRERHAHHVTATELDTIYRGSIENWGAHNRERA